MFTAFQEIEKRNFGLDLFRVFAILFVVLGHGFEYFPVFDNINIGFVDGVDLFFVLSGFLIGRIILKTIAKNKDFTFSDLFRFLKRRLLRTLPNYYLFLGLNILLVYTGVYDGLLNHNIAAYFIFLQNFFTPLDLLFWESWSLAVEEWFYLFFPISMLIAFAIFAKKINYKLNSILVILLLILIPLALRIINFDANLNSANWDLYFRKIVLLRFDAIAYGVLGAYIYINYKQWFLRFSKYLLFIGILGLAALKYIDFSPNSFFIQTFFFSIQSIFILFLIPSFYKIKLNNKRAKKSIGIISIVSYSTYLLHMPVLYLIKYFGLLSNSRVLLQISGFVLYMSIIFILSVMVYLFWERPITTLREKNIFGV